MSIFSSLGMKVAGGACAALIVFSGVQTFRLDRTQAALRDTKYELGIAHLLIKAQNDAADDLRREGDRRAKAAEAALSEARKAAAGDRELAKRLAEKRPLSGRCETPSEIMGADL